MGLDPLEGYMSVTRKLGKGTVRVVKDDLTDMAVDSFVFYAKPDLKLGTGYGNAVAVRGGPTIQNELKAYGTLKVGEAVVTGGGNLKAKHIVHAVGPAFQEEAIEQKLRTTTLNALRKAASADDVETVAMPPMGTGFYGVARETSASIMIDAIKEFFQTDTKIKEVIICVRDNWDIPPIQSVLEATN